MIFFQIRMAQNWEFFSGQKMTMVIQAYCFRLGKQVQGEYELNFNGNWGTSFVCGCHQIDYKTHYEARRTQERRENYCIASNY